VRSHRQLAGRVALSQVVEGPIVLQTHTNTAVLGAVGQVDTRFFAFSSLRGRERRKNESRG